MRISALVLALLIGSSWAAGQATYSGTYTSEGIKGTVTLVLTQDKDGLVSGTMSAAGAKMIIRAKVEGGTAKGIMSQEGVPGGVIFLAQKDGANLAVVIAEADAQGQPVQATARQIVFKVAAVAAAEPAAVAPAAVAPAANPLSPEDPYAGTYKGDAGRLVMEIQASQGQYSGSITLGAQKFPLKAAVKEGQLAGSFDSGGNAFEFTAALRGNLLTFKTGATVYLLEKEHKAVNPLEKPVAANPLEKPAAVNPLANDKPAAATAADDKWSPLARGKVFKHPTGGMLRYPDDWQIKETPEALQLIPPGAQPDEVYLVTGENAGGITRPDDPALIQLIDQLIARTAPLLKRVGQPEPIKSGSQDGVALSWEAVGPTGVAVRANLYLTILKGQAVSLFGIGTKQRVTERDKTLREIFSTFAWGESQIDRELIGAWHYWSYSGSTTNSGMASTETRRTVVLKEDGSFTWEGSSEGYLSARNTNSLGNETSRGAAVGNSGSGTRGTWAAGDGKLYLTHQDGTYVAVKYEIKGQRGNRFLYIDNGAKKPQEWSENKVGG